MDDSYVSHAGDDIAILLSHQKGTENEDIHKLALDAFLEGTSVAKKQGLYGAGQDLLSDAFDHQCWDYIRTKVSRKAVEIREQGFSGATMLPYGELEYGGIVERMKKLDKRFKIRK